MEGFQRVQRTTVSFDATHRPAGWLTHRLTVGADWTDTRNSELDRPVGNNPLGSAEAQRQSAQYLTLDYWATVALAAGDVTFASTAGAQYYERQRDWLYAQGVGFAAPTLETLSGTAVRTVEEDFLENRTVGAYIQEQFGWRDRLFLTLALRGDDNSAFGQDYDFVLYPKASASWVVSDEAFARGWRGLSTLRLRAAWGRSGQQPDAFAALRTYEPAVGPAGTPTVRPENIGNPDLEPEVGDEIEVGFDAALFAERIGLEVTLYRQVRNDALVQVPVRPSTGFPGVRFENLGSVRNRGLEAFLHGEVWRAGSFGLDLGLQLALNQNRLTSLGGEGPRQLRPGQYLVEGFPIGSIFAKRVVSSELEGVGATSRAVNTLCEGGTPIPGSESLAAFGLSRGGGSPVPCAEAPLVYWGEPIPTRNLTGTVPTVAARLTRAERSGGLPGGIPHGEWDGLASPPAVPRFGTVPTAGRPDLRRLPEHEPGRIRRRPRDH